MHFALATGFSRTTLLALRADGTLWRTEVRSAESVDDFVPLGEGSGMFSVEVLVGGGVAHGPHPRSYRKRMPKRMRRLALRVALSDKVRDDAVTVVNELSVDAPKTSVIRDLVSGLGLSGKTLIVTGATDQNIVKSVSNMPSVDVLAAPLLNPLQAVGVANLVLTEDAVKAIDGLWGEDGGSKR